MRDLFRRTLARLSAAFEPPDAFAGPGWHVSGRDWPAESPGVSEGEVWAALDGITPQLAQAASVSLLGAGERDG